MAKIMFLVCPPPAEGWWGTPVPGSFQGLWYQVLSGGLPQSFPEDTPVPAGGGYPSPSQDRTGISCLTMHIVAHDKIDNYAEKNVFTVVAVKVQISF